MTALERPARRVVLVVLGTMACAGPRPGADGVGSGDASPADSGVGWLAPRVDAIMRPAFASRPASLDACIGGVAVVVTATEELTGGWGATTLGGSSAPDGSTAFQVGSVTKLFTGLALARLVEEGAVSLDASPRELLGPDLRDATRSWPTVGALITHHGGLPTFPRNLVDRDGDGVRDVDIDPRSPASGYGRADLRRALEGWSPRPGATYSYSNLGIGLVGLALQDRLALADHHAVLRRLVTDDLGMSETWGEVAAVPDAVRTRLATGYVSDGATRSVGVPGEMGVLAAAGEIVTTARDLRLLLRALVGLDHTPLDGAIARATTPLADGPAGRQIGYALEIDAPDGRVRYRKGGNTSSYAAYIMWSTTPQVGVAVLTNCGGFATVVSLAEALHEAAQAP